MEAKNTNKSSYNGIKYGGNAILMSLIFLAILVLIQIIVVDKKIQFDLTQDKIFTLSEQTQKTLGGLKNKIQIVAFVPKNLQTGTKDLLEQYKTLSSNISYEMTDPDLNPGKAKNYQIRERLALVVVNGTKQEKIYEITEEKLTNALIKVTKDGQKKIYFAQGHGEKLITNTEKDGLSFLKEELSKENYVVDSMILAQTKDIPTDASVVVLPGVEKDMLPEEETTLKNYISKGGHVVIMTDPDGSASLRKFLEQYNLKIRNDVIVDKFSKAFGGDFLMPMGVSYAQHPITRSLQGINTIFAIASSIDTNVAGKTGITIENLVSTSPQSWGEMNKELLKKNQAGIDPEDAKGPLTIAALATIKVSSDNKDAKKDTDKDTKEKSGQILLFGDSDFVANANLKVAGNLDFTLNSINWMAEEDDLIAIKPKDRKNTPLVLDESKGKMIFWANLVFLPFAVALLGTVLISRRRLKTA